MKKKTILFSILLVIVSLLMFLPCGKDLYCEGPLASTVQYPFLWFLLFVPLSLLALTLNDQKYKFWLKFTGVFFVSSMIIVFLMPETARGLMLNPDRESTNWFFIILYSFMSIIYFGVQYFKKK